jgi:hypothetical protein
VKNQASAWRENRRKARQSAASGRNRESYEEKISENELVVKRYRLENNQKKKYYRKQQHRRGGNRRAGGNEKWRKIWRIAAANGVACRRGGMKENQWRNGGSKRHGENNRNMKNLKVRLRRMAKISRRKLQLSVIEK